MSVTVWMNGAPGPISYEDEHTDRSRVLKTWRVEAGALRIYEFEWRAVGKDFEPVGERCFATYNSHAWVRVEGTEHVPWGH